MKILTPIFLVGCMPFVYIAFARYPPVDIVVVMALFAVGFVMAALFLRGGRNRNVRAAYLVTALLPWLAAGWFLANGALDQSEEIRHQTVVVETRYSFRGLRDRLVVRSWRSGRTSEWIYVSALQPFFYRGESVTVCVKSGALGLPWISRVLR